MYDSLKVTCLQRSLAPADDWANPGLGAVLLEPGRGPRVLLLLLVREHEGEHPRLLVREDVRVDTYRTWNSKV